MKSWLLANLSEQFHYYTEGRLGQEGHDHHHRLQHLHQDRVEPHDQQECIPCITTCDTVVNQDEKYIFF